MKRTLILLSSSITLGLCSSSGGKYRLPPANCPDSGPLTSWDSCRDRYSSNTTWDDISWNNTYSNSGSESDSDSDDCTDDSDNSTTTTLGVSENRTSSTEATERLPVILFEQDCCYEDMQQICTCRIWDNWCRAHYSTCCGPIRECAEQCVCIPDELVCGQSKFERVCSDPYVGQPTNTNVGEREVKGGVSGFYACPDCST